MIETPVSTPTVMLRKMQSRYPYRTIRAGGFDWRIRDTGGALAPLLLMPGGLGNADIFYHQMLELAPEIRCITVDYPDADHAATADGLAALLDALQLERASVLGSSLAGYWLQYFGVRHAERVDVMILANSFCGAHELRQHPLFAVPMLRGINGDALKAEWLVRLGEREPDELRDVQIALLQEGQEGELLRRRLLAAATASSAPLIERGQFPLYILDCMDDPLLPARTRDALAQRYPDAICLSLPQGGHYPAITQYEAYNRFLRSAVPDEQLGTS